MTRLIDGKADHGREHGDEENGLARDDGERPARIGGFRCARRRRNVEKREADGADDVQHDHREIRARVRHVEIVSDVALAISGPSNALNKPPASTHEIAFGLKASEAVSVAANRKNPCVA